MTKKTESEKIAALTLVALERIAGSLRNIEVTLASPRKTRWYEASWVTPRDSEEYGSKRRHHVAVEAFDAEEARNTLRTELNTACASLMVPREALGDGMLLRHLKDFQLRPLGEHQCRFCCAANWAEDGERCNECRLTPQMATEERRAGRFYMNPRMGR